MAGRVDDTAGLFKQDLSVLFHAANDGGRNTDRCLGENVVETREIWHRRAVGWPNPCIRECRRRSRESLGHEQVFSVRGETELAVEV